MTVLTLTANLLGPNESIWKRPEQKGTVWIGEESTELTFSVWAVIRFHNKKIVEQDWENDFPGIEHFNEPQLEQLKARLRIQAKMVAISGEEKTIEI